MSSTDQVIESRPVYPHVQTTCSSCHFQLEFPVPSPVPKPATMFTIRCCSCKQTFSHTFYPNQVPSGMLSTGGPSSQGHAPTPPPRKGRKIGTQERPLETVYYDRLGVPVDATTDDIKKAYRMPYYTLSIPRWRQLTTSRVQVVSRSNSTLTKTATTQMLRKISKSIAIAYQTLSDPQLRHKYNEFGPKDSAPEGGFVDPEEVFGAIFGGERFLPLIGHLSLARDMKSALQEADEDAGEDAPPVARDAKGREIVSVEEKAKRDEKSRKAAAEKAAAREERVQKLVENLQHKLGIFTENATGPNDPEVIDSWSTICSLEAESVLFLTSYFVVLLTIPFLSKFLASNQSFLGVGGWLHNVQGKYHVFSETVSTLRSAIELKTGAKLEIDSVIRETCDRVLNDPSIPRDKAILRAVALQILGNAFAAVRNEREEAREESEYVKIETKSSRQRAQSRAAHGQ
ncbi:DnaJ-domain-containing protein [Lactarius indigo]|nr:DnaJ-domain-containing protein [Lactarius indigo]